MNLFNYPCEYKQFTKSFKYFPLQSAKIVLNVIYVRTGKKSADWWSDIGINLKF